MRPTLSICIPSYQRARLLAPLLRELDAPDFLPFSFEVVVADNASTDEGYREIERYTPANYTLRYYCNNRNVGAIPNLFGTLRRAEGEFCLYLADDDRLVQAHLIDAVETMRRSPDIVATHCCWQALDLVSGQVTPPLIEFDDLVFPPDAAASLVQHYFFTGFQPEIGIYRTDILADCLFPTEIFFWALALTDRLLQRGSIRVTDKPFYNIVSRHPDEPFPRDRLTNSVDFAMWESVSRSYDFMMLRHFGGQDLPPEVRFRSDLTAMRNWCLHQAMVIHFEHGDYLVAFELACLLRARGADIQFLTTERQTRLERRAALMAFVEALAWTPEINKVVLLGFDAGTQAELSEILRGLLPATIALGDPHADIAPSTAFLIGDDTTKPALIDRGISPALACHWPTLQAVFR